MVAIALQIIYEPTTAVLLFAISEQRTSEVHLSVWTFTKLTAAWARIHDTPLIMAGHAFTVAACGMAVSANLPMDDCCVVASCDDDFMGFNDTARRLVARKTSASRDSNNDAETMANVWLIAWRWTRGMKRRSKRCTP